MNIITIEGNIRNETGKKEIIILRKQNNIPCILYDKNINIKFYTHINSFKNIIYTKIFNKILIKLNGENIESILQDIQFHPVSDEIIHADFYKLNIKKYITLSIPIKIFGRSIGVSKGGECCFNIKKLKIKTLPTNIPKNIEVDISHLEIGDRISIGDIHNNKYTIMHPDNNIIVAIRPSRTSIKTDQENQQEKPKN